MHGPLILSELLEREGHQVRFFLEEKGWLSRLAAWAPDVVALSASTGNHIRLLRAAERIKANLNPAPVTVMGGPHPTFFPDVVRHPALDAICRGEGDLAFPLFLSGIEDGRPPEDTPNFWVRKDDRIIRNEMGPLVRHLDRLPFSRRRIYDASRALRTAPAKTVFTGRGCPNNCIFCFNHAYRSLVKGKGPFLRRRSVSHVMEEILYLDKNFGFRSLEFYDDIFTLDRQWVFEFADEYGRLVKKPYTIITAADRMDEELAEALHASGCAWVAFGIESGNEELRKKILKKPVANEDIRRCAGLLRKKGIRYYTFNILAMPEEKRENALETLHLNQEIRSHHAFCSIAQPYPGTRLAELAVEMGLATREELERDSESMTSFLGKSIFRNGNDPFTVNLQKFFPLLVKAPALEPLILPLLKLPPNQLFLLVHQAIHGLHVKARQNEGWFRAAARYLRNRNVYYGKST
ncbi:MAG: radical SAM protein [Thermodesulfobacteriota bacterium]